MVSRNPILKLLAIVCIAISAGTISNANEHISRSILAMLTLRSYANEHRDFSSSSSPSARSISQDPQTQPTIATLANGNYQFCTQPPPSDWRSGSGVCFNFAKIGDRVSGYYGYPYTDDFICVRGKVKGNLVTGEALMISWLGREWTSLPKTAFKWDEEGRLTLKEGKIIRTSTDAGGRTDWILFRAATLDTRGFYRSNKLPLTSISQLCNWK